MPADLGYCPTDLRWSRKQHHKLLQTGCLLERPVADQRFAGLDIHAATGYSVRDVTADGNCFFRGLSLLIFGHEQDHMLLRQRIVAWQEEHKGDLGVVQSYSDERMEDQGSWATEAEVQAAACLLKTPIVIHTKMVGVKKKYRPEGPWIWNEVMPLKKKRFRHKIYLQCNNTHFRVITAFKFKKKDSELATDHVETKY